jgi:hypothetical protein
MMNRPTFPLSYSNSKVSVKILFFLTFLNFSRSTIKKLGSKPYKSIDESKGYKFFL